MQPMEFTYDGPLDEVELYVRVKRGESITVPADAAGRPPSITYEDDGVTVKHNDPGAGLLAQPSAWVPTVTDLDALTVEDLKKLAASRGIDLDGATKKADIVAAIEKGA